MRNDTPDSPRCGTCANFSLPKGEKLSKHGFGRCAFMPEWRTPSSEARCDFAPTRHRAATERRA